MQGVDHYENFPVASWLCPARLRPTVTALYHYARSADDIADEGDASPAQRLAELAAYRAELERALAGQTPADARWSGQFSALARAIAARDLVERQVADERGAAFGLRRGELFVGHVTAFGLRLGDRELVGLQLREQLQREAHEGSCVHGVVPFVAR